MKPVNGAGCRERIVSAVIGREDENSCWCVPGGDDPRHPEWKHYVPVYTSTLWTLLLVADLDTPFERERFRKPFRIVSDHLFDPREGIYTIGKSHFPIPCLNGNMLYLHACFDSGTGERVAGTGERVDRVVGFFDSWQRFDDGDFRTPSGHPYFGNRSCYGKHTCYWGVAKLLKGLSFIPPERRTKGARELLRRCVDFVLLHEVCFASHARDNLLHPSMGKTTFPTMYRSDCLELLWLLGREGIESPKLDRARALIAGKRRSDGTWALERRVGRLIVPLGPGACGNELVTRRARAALG